MKKILSLIILLIFSFDSLSQRKQKKKNTNANLITYDLPNLKWRSIGPYRGGRSATVTGTTNSKSTYYFGATGGGAGGRHQRCHGFTVGEEAGGGSQKLVGEQGESGGCGVSL